MCHFQLIQVQECATVQKSRENQNNNISVHQPVFSRFKKENVFSRFGSECQLTLGVIISDITAICEPFVYNMWESQRFTTLWTSIACYRDSFVLPFIFHGGGYILPATKKYADQSQ
jgi:hypothetical protein